MFVWRLQDIIGVVFFGFIGLVAAYVVIVDKYTAWRHKRRKKKEGEQ